MSFDEAAVALQAGRLDDAELACNEVLRSCPTHDESMNLLGIVALRRGQTERAQDFIKRALSENPQNSAYHANLAKVSIALTRLGEAEFHYREALRLDAADLTARMGLGHLLRDQKRLSEAEACFCELVRLCPDDADLQAIYGNILHDLGRLREAELRYREACHLRPNYPEVFNNLGNLLQALGRLSEAELHFRHAISLKSNFPEAHNNLGNLLFECGRVGEAEIYCREALRLRPGYASAHSNLANALLERDEYQTAEFHYREAIRQRAEYPEAHNNLGSLLGRQGRWDEAEASYRRAIELRPGYHDPHINLGMMLMGQGNFEEGLPTYDTHRRFEKREDLTGRQWQGEALGDRALLIYAEQGFGDIIQFCRFVPLAAARARIIFEIPRQLKTLFGSLSGVDRIVVRGDPLPSYDAHCALLSLPRWLDIRIDRVASAVPYLSVDPATIQKWRLRVDPLRGLRVGLVWAGNPALANDRRRSFDLERLRELANISGVSFVSLQKGAAGEQAASPPRGMVLYDWTSELLDFADTAALILALDLVVAVDTAVAHLAGALGRPVWLLNRFNTCWRWAIDSKTSPWYRTLRQFKQPSPGDWDSVFEQVKPALIELQNGLNRQHSST